jgi:hypothetical protein
MDDVNRREATAADRIRECTYVGASIRLDTIDPPAMEDGEDCGRVGYRKPLRVSPKTPLERISYPISA